MVRGLRSLLPWLRPRCTWSASRCSRRGACRRWWPRCRSAASRTDSDAARGPASRSSGPRRGRWCPSRGSTPRASPTCTRSSGRTTRRTSSCWWWSRRRTPRTGCSTRSGRSSRTPTPRSSSPARPRRTAGRKSTTSWRRCGTRWPRPTGRPVAGARATAGRTGLALRRQRRRRQHRLAGQPRRPAVRAAEERGHDRLPLARACPRTGGPLRWGGRIASVINGQVADLRLAQRRRLRVGRVDGAAGGDRRGRRPAGALDRAALGRLSGDRRRELEPADLCPARAPRRVAGGHAAALRSSSSRGGSTITVSTHRCSSSWCWLRWWYCLATLVAWAAALTFPLHRDRWCWPFRPPRSASSSPRTRCERPPAAAWSASCSGRRPTPGSSCASAGPLGDDAGDGAQPRAAAARPASAGRSAGAATATGSAARWTSSGCRESSTTSVDALPTSANSRSAT